MQTWSPDIMTATIDPPPAPVTLTKDYIRKAYKHLEETEDLDFRNEFFKQYMIDNVTWEITGNGHELAGVRHSLSEHSAASFSKLGRTTQLFFALPLPG